jgi:hypothetical protein
MRRRREVEVFSLSFLDCICCGFGAIILLLVLTEVNQPVQLEKSRKSLDGQVRELTRQLAEIRGETDELNRALQGSRETLEQARLKLSHLSGDVSHVRGELAASQQDAAVTNKVEGGLVSAYQKLSSEMQRLLQEQGLRVTTRAVGGIPIDSEYLIFIVDTSDSMTSNHWEENLAIIDEILGIYPQVKGLQVMNDQGTYMFEGTQGSWLTDSARLRADIKSRARTWRAYSQSNPVPGIEEALRTYASGGRRMSLFVLGDEFTGDSYQAALDAIDRLNRAAPDGHLPARIHAIGFPEGPDMPDDTNTRFAALMRLVCEHNGGTFVGMKR